MYNVEAKHYRYGRILVTLLGTQSVRSEYQERTLDTDSLQTHESSSGRANHVGDSIATTEAI